MIPPGNGHSFIVGYKSPVCSNEMFSMIFFCNFFKVVLNQNA